MGFYIYVSGFDEGLCLADRIRKGLKGLIRRTEFVGKSARVRPAQIEHPRDGERRASSEGARGARITGAVRASSRVGLVAARRSDGFKTGPLSD